MNLGLFLLPVVVAEVGSHAPGSSQEGGIEGCRIERGRVARHHFGQLVMVNAQDLLLRDIVVIGLASTTLRAIVVVVIVGRRRNWSRGSGGSGRRGGTRSRWGRRTWLHFWTR